MTATLIYPNKNCRQTGITFGYQPAYPPFVQIVLPGGSYFLNYEAAKTQEFTRKMKYNCASSCPGVSLVHAF